MTNALSELGKRRDLLYAITWREIKIRYKQSVMGFLWAILLPAVIIAAGVLVRFGMSALSGKAVPAQDLAGVTVKALVWAFFAGAMRFSSTSLVGNANLVTKIYMPREIFPIAAVLSQLIDFLVAGALVGLGLLIAGFGLSWQLLWVPVLLLLTIALATGWALLLSAACLFYRDVKYFVEVFITFAIFITPIFYDVEMFKRWANILNLNPLAPLIEGISKCAVYHVSPDLLWVSYSALAAAGSLIGGFHLFKKWEPGFAESI
jgi:ABC-type polysaccharide/polyol phosphate export permease